MAKQFLVQATIRAKDEASPVVAGVQSRFAKLGSTLSSFATGAVVAGTAAFAGLVAVMKNAVSAASESEDAAKRLENALAPLGASASGVATALREQAAALQEKTRFDDDAIVSGQALLAIYVKNEEQLKRGTQAAVDFAAATGTELQTAFSILAKAAAGNTAALSRYGIVLDDGIPKGERFAAALSKINENMGGRAVADAKTFSGAVAKLGNQIGELNEALGDGVAANEDFKRGIDDAATAAIAARPAFEELGTVIGGALGRAVKFASELGAVLAGLTADVLTGSRVGFADAAASATSFGDAMRNTAAATAELRAQREAAVEADRKAAAATQTYIDSMRSAEAAVTSYGAAVAPAAAQTDDLATSADAAGTKISELATSTAPAVASLDRVRAAAALTSAQFDALAAAAGRAAAVQAALDGGAQLTQGGTRVRLDAYSSRLVSSPGGAANVGRFTGFPVGVVSSVERRYTVTSSGRVVPY